MTALQALSLLFAAMVFGSAVTPANAAYSAVAGKTSIKKQRTPPKGSPVNVVTDKLEYDGRTKIATATGRVVITYGNYVLVATKAVYNTNTDTMRAIGEVRLREPGGNIMEADIAQLQNRFRDGFARHLRLLMTNDATITADYAKRQDGTITTYTHVTYTRCKTCMMATGEPLWQIRSLKVVHNEDEHTVYHTDATFEFLGAPVFWLPFFSHPDPTVKRRTGFLIPRFNYSNTYGFGVEIPYFINLAPNYDLTLRPLITSTQGPLLRAEWRHRLEKGSYSVDAGGIYQLDKNLPSPGDRRLRGFVRTTGNFSITKHWNWGWDGTVSTDDTFMRRYDIDKRTLLTNRAYLTGIRNRNFFSAEALHFRGLLNTDNNDIDPIAVPYLRHQITLDQPVFGGQLGFNTNFYSIHRKKSNRLNPAFNEVNQGTDQTRAVIEGTWKRQIISGMGHVITPFASLRGDVFVTDRVPTAAGINRRDKITTRFLPTAGVDIRWPFVRSDELGQQVITPVFQLISSRNEHKTEYLGNEDAASVNFDSSNLFLHDRFTGKDRYEGGTRVNAGFLYNWMFNDGGFARASFGQSIHLSGRNSFIRGTGLNGNYSDFIAALAFQPNEQIRFNYQARFDQKSFNIHSQEIGLSYGMYGFTGNIDYVQINSSPAFGRLSSEEQIWASAQYKFDNDWNVFGSMRYDLARNRQLNHTVGVGYDCDCFAFSLAYEESHSSDRDADVSRSVKMTIEFKTLGSATIGSGL